MTKQAEGIPPPCFIMTYCTNKEQVEQNQKRNPNQKREQNARLTYQALMILRIWTPFWSRLEPFLLHKSTKILFGSRAGKSLAFGTFLERFWAELRESLKSSVLRWLLRVALFSAVSVSGPLLEPEKEAKLSEKGSWKGVQKESVFVPEK